MTAVRWNLCTMRIQFEGFDDFLTFARWSKVQSDINRNLNIDHCRESEREASFYFLRIDDFESCFRRSTDNDISKLESSFFFTVNTAGHGLNEERKINGWEMISAIYFSHVLKR